jgi:ribosomal protein S18 acetylase RimI-like enzyme
VADSFNPDIRRAQSADAPLLARLRYEFRASVMAVEETEAAFLDRCIPWMTARLNGDSTWRARVAELDGLACGAVWLQLIEKLPNPASEAERHGYISSLYVREAFRGYGLGSALLTTMVLECDAQDVDVVMLWPTPDSRRLYERHGFTVRDDVLCRRRT